MRRTTLLAACLLLLAPGARAADDAGAPKGPEPGPISPRKLNTYIKGYNLALGTFGVVEEAKIFAAQQIGQKSANQPTFVNVGWVDQAEDEIQQARAIPNGGLPEVDAVADQLIPKLDSLTKHLKGLEAYFESRGNLEDDMARAKREDPIVRQEFKDSVALLEQLSTALDGAIARRDEAELARYKASGDMVGYDGNLALQKAKALVDLFNSPADIKDPAIITKGDALVATIESTLQDLSKQLDAVKAAGGDSEHGLRNSGISSAADRLQGVIGAYRNLKHSGNPALMPMLVGAYNNAVDEMNIGN